MNGIELFAGCGGLALGVARAGFKHKLVVEKDPEAVSTLTTNHRAKILFIREWNISHADTRDIDFKKFEGIDLISGGPPCQPFSIGGRHLGPRDPRNMWPEAVRAIRESRPKAFLMENVRGIFRPDFERYLKYLVLQLSYPSISPRRNEHWTDHLSRLTRLSRKAKGGALEYNVVARAINAADYGAPQRRHRAIFMGLSAHIGSSLEFPRATASHDALVWAKHIENDYWRKHGIRRVGEPCSPSEARAIARLRETLIKPPERPWMTVRDAIGDLPRPSSRETVAGHWQHDGARAYPNHTGSLLDEPAKALKAGSHGVPGGENMLSYQTGRVRYFTVRELARLQGFPDDFGVCGSWKAATRQLGNAVPVTVGEAMGRHLRYKMSRA